MESWLLTLIIRVLSIKWRYNKEMCLTYLNKKRSLTGEMSYLQTLTPTIHMAQVRYFLEITQSDVYQMYRVALAIFTAKVKVGQEKVLAI